MYYVSWYMLCGYKHICSKCVDKSLTELAYLLPDNNGTAQTKPEQPLANCKSITNCKILSHKFISDTDATLEDMNELSA